MEEIRETDGDAVLVTYVTPNRSDLLSVLGVAREVSALLDLPLNAPCPSLDESDTGASSLASVEILSPVSCPRYSARILTGITITDSPVWMQRRLLAAGMRPINNVVDATNYVLLELGQPLHAFDYDLLADHRIIVRQAKAGERIVTIDGEERTLDEDVLVIADPKHAVAIAGVMGGLDSEVSERTTNLLLESAHFNRLSIRRTARKLGMSTEASYRFERGVDPELTIRALDRVSALIQETGGGEIARGVIDAYPDRICPTELTLRPDRARMMLGMDIEDNLMFEYLSRLGMGVSKADDFRITVPTFRPDIAREVDLIEEVGRVHGYENIPETLPTGRTMQGSDSAQGKFQKRVTELLISCGLQEVVTNTMVPTEPGGDGQVSVRNALSDELCCLRCHLIPNLLRVLSYNSGRGSKDLGVFEVGHVFEPEGDSAVVERRSIAAAITGSMWEKPWNVEKGSLVADYHACKGVLEALLGRIGIDDIAYVPKAAPGFHPNRSAVVLAGGTELGVIGEISSDRAAEYDLSGRVCAFELNAEPIMGLISSGRKYAPVSRYPSSARDLAVVVADDVTYKQVSDIIIAQAGELLESATLFDLYQGQPLPAGHKSLAFNIVFRSNERTLRDEEVDERLDCIRKVLAGELAASFR